MVARRAAVERLVPARLATGTRAGRRAGGSPSPRSPESSASSASRAGSTAPSSAIGSCPTCCHELGRDAGEQLPRSAHARTSADCRRSLPARTRFSGRTARTVNLRIAFTRISLEEPHWCGKRCVGGCQVASRAVRSGCGKDCSDQKSAAATAPRRCGRAVAPALGRRCRAVRRPCPRPHPDPRALTPGGRGPVARHRLQRRGDPVPGDRLPRGPRPDRGRPAPARPGRRADRAPDAPASRPAPTAGRSSCSSRPRGSGATASRRTPTSTRPGCTTRR